MQEGRTAGIPAAGNPAADGRRRRWDGHRVARRAEFVAGAVEAVRTHGPGAGLDEIAAQLGVSKSVVYRHFADRADLFAAVLDRVVDDVLMPRLVAELSAVGPIEVPVGDGSGADPPADAGPVDLVEPATVRAVVRAYVGVVADEPELYRFVLAHARDGRSDDFVEATEQRVAQLLAQLLGDRLRVLGMDSGGAEVWAFGVVGLVQLATRRWADRPTMSAEALVAYLTLLVVGGLEGVARASGSPARLDGGGLAAGGVAASE